MSRVKKYDLFVGDLETLKGETTKTWACGVSHIDEDLTLESVKVSETIFEMFDNVASITTRKNVCIYFHNLAFDGNFILNELFNSGYKNAKKDRELNKNEVEYVVDGKGIWFLLRFYFKNVLFEIRDSLKIIPMSVAEAGKAFNTKFRKLEIDYDHEGEATEKEIEYLKHDVLVMKEAIYKMQENGITKLTIGKSCKDEFLKKFDSYDIHSFFPDLTKIRFPNGKTADEYCRNAYRGGYMFIKKGIEGKNIDNGVTIDKNSLYPYVMHSKSKNRYPIGKPKYYEIVDNKLPEQFTKVSKNGVRVYYSFINFRFSSCKLKDRYLPCIKRIGGKWIYNSKGETDKTYFNGKEWISKGINMTLTMVDFDMFIERYDIEGLELKSCCCFMSCEGLFDEYIDKYYALKSKDDGLRIIWKLMINNLSGQFAKNPVGTKTIFSNDVSEGLKIEKQIVTQVKAFYIPIGCAITSYGRKEIIEDSEQNIDRLCYIDTDSQHLQGDLSGLDVKISKELGDYKVECDWKRAKFFKLKSYIEQEKSGKYQVTFAGLSQKVTDKLADEMAKNEHTYDEIGIGYEVKGMLKAKCVKGGIVLEDTHYTI